MNFIIVFLILHIISPSNGGSFMPTKADFKNYGEYTIEIESLEVCKGPKAVNLSTTAFTLTTMKNDTQFVLEMMIPKPVVLDEVKISVYTIKDEETKFLWNNRIAKPCQHFAFGDIISSFVEKPVSKCVLKKGRVYVKGMMNEMVKNIFGSSFFYGKYIFKVFILSKSGNVLCVKDVVEFKKKGAV